MEWLRRLFGGLDRTTAAADRAAKAGEDIADMMESVRDQLRARLGIEGPAPVVVKPIAAKSDEQAAEEGGNKGKRGRG